ncbi:muscle M-line assembly protein unc-89-like [Macrobrachium rosenbergii]|uniref:muscle M-line assembly protein unc-89-like n=1 Tax=Macrobrachium rosenbergii TaxID=79674 RepID=UPI0034D4E6D4
MEPTLLFLLVFMATCEVIPTEASASLNLAQGRRPQTSSSSSSSSSSVSSIGGPPMRFPPKVSGFVVVSEGNYDHEHHTHTHGEEPHRVPSPQFVTNNTTTTEVYLGSTAKLDCTVDDLTNESVSWLRRVDDVLELITWEEHTYSKDSRYSLDHDSGDRWQQWQLIIQNVQSGDAGQYRCQVATQPPMVLNAQLQVIEPRVRVVDERGTKVVEKHYNSGSMIELKCVIEFVPFPHGPVTWRRGNTTLTFNTSTGGISVKGDSESGYIRSRLYVANATPRHSGIYSCWYSNYSSDTVTVHVIAGENPAELHHDAVPGDEEEEEEEKKGRSRRTARLQWLLEPAEEFPYSSAIPVSRQSGCLPSASRS